MSNFMPASRHNSTFGIMIINFFLPGMGEKNASGLAKAPSPVLAGAGAVGKGGAGVVAQPAPLLPPKS
jgi:hypothetical protein